MAALDTPPYLSAQQAPEESLRAFAEQAIARSAGAALIPGNAVRILRDSTENYPAWLTAIEEAQREILFENYIIGRDGIGRRFVAALARRAAQGLRVRLIYDWLGSFPARDLFAPLIAAGGEVRCFNPPRLDSPFGWLTRDHRKMLAVDRRVAFVSGLCIARRWTGSAARRVPPWRDTGVEVHGPAVAEIEAAFYRIWDTMGAKLVTPALPTIPPAGDTNVMVVAGEPVRGGLYRLDQFIATVARSTLWLTDAYYVATPPYVEALRMAARDGVDVRLLVPGSSDLPLTQAFSRSGYRALLEAGVRVFEWNGSMLHAKTAVADRRWSRVGSSNLNLSSWLANYELDLAVHDEAFGAQMERMYLDDLTNATEIVLSRRNRVRSVRRPARPHMPHLQPMRGSASRAAASALRIGNTVTAALTDRRVLGASEAGMMLKFGVALSALAAIALVFPRAIAIPIALLTGWIGIALLVKAWRLRRGAPMDEDKPGAA
jgi:cardiolipin synthase